MKPMLAQKWSGQDPTGWYMSEKLDGIRAIWDGVGFMSRNEKEFIAPDWFKFDMPKCLLDGELWMGRGRFSETSGQVRRKTNQDWSEIKYIVFDIPKTSDSFRFRNMLLTHIHLPGHASVHEQTLCKCPKHLLDFETNIISNSGEGVMLHHPDSAYEFGKRSKYLLKVKRFNDDEAVVCGYLDGKGKHVGRVGALLCVYKDKEIHIGTGFSDEERINPPKIGEVIIFKYFEMFNNIPRFPVYVGVRVD